MNAKATLWITFGIASVVIGLILFLSAGTFDYWQAWVFLVVSGIASVPPTLAIVQDPILLENRATGGPTKEQRPVQKIIVLLMGLPASAAFVVPGLDFRFGWSSVPPWLSLVGNLFIIASMWLVYRVYKENSYGATTVGLAEGHQVISTGPYAVVRNPMYSAAAVWFVGMVLALGSFWGLIPAVLTTFGLVWRLIDEEKFLTQNLPGYHDYCARVRWHLIPGIY